MSLTLDEIYDRNQCLNAVTKIEIKRRNLDDSYETDWVDLESITTHPYQIEESISTISYKIPNESYQFGIVEVPNCKLSFCSVWGEFAKEDDTRSIWYGYKRHLTLVRIMFGYKDTKTGDEALEEEYRGFVNDESSNTRVDETNTIQHLQIEDVLTYLLKKYTIADIAPTEVNLDAIVYEVMNRTEFTDFLTVSSGNINPGYNVQNISYTDGDGNDSWYGNTQILTFFQDLSTGHSFFYQKAGVFYFQPLEPGTTTLKSFDEAKIVKYQNYKRGIDNVYERIYWEETNTYWEATTIKYNKELTINVPGVYAYAQRLAYLAAVGAKTSKEYDGFIIEIPLYPKVFILDRIQVIAGSYDQPDAFILGKSVLGVDYLRQYLGANYSDDTKFWMVKGVKHDHKGMKTTIEVQSF